MKILVAEDQTVSRRILEASLRKWGYEVEGVENGTRAWEILQGEEAPQLAILDWLMPGMDGIEICRQIRLRPQTQPVYIILLTARSGREDMIRGLEAGADDYITKPFDRDELRARVQVGIRVLELQGALAHRVRQLEEALSRVKQLQGLLPICSYCKKIRNDRNYWQQVEGYISERTEAQFSHGICPECYAQYVQPELDRLQRITEGVP
ncbi:MAG: response regulator [Terriglobia bacterium]|jgi:DNA-binding response OmpR family regulator